MRIVPINDIGGFGNGVFLIGDKHLLVSKVMSYASYAASAPSRAEKLQFSGGDGRVPFSGSSVKDSSLFNRYIVITP